MKSVGLSLVAGFMVTACSGEKAGTSPEVQTVKVTSTTSDPAPSQPTSQQSTETVDPVMARGKRMFLRCKSCHTVDEGGRNGTGPNLYKIFGAEAAKKDGFKFSKAMEESGIIWDEETMDAWIVQPRELVPGTSMAFVGLKKPEDREALIKYLKKVTE